MITKSIKPAKLNHQIHNSGVIHRDLKPENIIIAQDDEPTIMDFGLAKDINLHLTTSGILGTPSYKDIWR